MRSCPICRRENVVACADAGNLDIALENFIKLYFPKEIREKSKDTERERAMEEIEALTGRQWSKNTAGDCVTM